MGMIKVNKCHSLTGHKDAVYTIERGLNDNDIFSAGGDGMVSHWKLDSPNEGELIAKLPNSIFSLHHLKDRDQLVVGQNFEGIHLLDIHEKKEIASLKIGNSYIFDIQSYQQELFIACGDGRVAIIGLDDWSVRKHMHHSASSARSIAVNKDRQVFAVGYSDHSIRVYSLVDFSLLKEWKAHDNSVFSVKFTADGRYLLSGSRDAHLKVWDLDHDYQLYQDIVAHMYTINHIEFSPDNKHFVTCSLDKSIKVWDSEAYKLLKVIDKSRHAGHGTSVNKLAWTSFHNQLISASDDRTLSIWEIIF